MINKFKKLLFPQFKKLVGKFNPREKKILDRISNLQLIHFGLGKENLLTFNLFHLLKVDLLWVVDSLLEVMFVNFGLLFTRKLKISIIRIG